MIPFTEDNSTVWYHCQEVMMVFYKRIMDLRCDNDKTQQQVADYLKCNRQVYARYERGIREIPVSMLVVLAKYYGTSTDYLLGLTDDPAPYKGLKKR